MPVLFRGEPLRNKTWNSSPPAWQLVNWPIAIALKELKEPDWVFQILITAVIHIGMYCVRTDAVQSLLTIPLKAALTQRDLFEH